jgi:hypothetical protein
MRIFIWWSCWRLFVICTICVVLFLFLVWIKISEQFVCQPAIINSRRTYFLRSKYIISHFDLFSPRSILLENINIIRSFKRSRADTWFGCGHTCYTWHESGPYRESFTAALREHRRSAINHRAYFISGLWSSSILTLRIKIIIIFSELSLVLKENLSVLKQMKRSKSGWSRTHL